MNKFEESQMVYDVLIDGEGDQWRVDRLMRTYLRIDHEQKHRIKALKDHEGCLHVYLNKINLEICAEAQRAWNEENENMLVFYSCMEKFCEVA